MQCYCDNKQLIKPHVWKMIHSKGLKVKSCHSIAWYMEGCFLITGESMF